MMLLDWEMLQTNFLKKIAVLEKVENVLTKFSLLDL